MSKNELVSKIEKLQEWEQLIEEAKAEAESLRDEIKCKNSTVIHTIFRATCQLFCTIIRAII